MRMLCEGPFQFFLGKVLQYTSHVEINDFSKSGDIKIGSEVKVLVTTKQKRFLTIFVEGK